MAGSLAALHLRAWHHFPHATPFIDLIRDVFEGEGFEIRPEKTRMQFFRNGHWYVVDIDHRPSDDHQMASIRRRGRGTAPIYEVDFTAMQERVRHIRSVAEYRTAVQPICDAARATRLDSDGAMTPAPALSTP